MMAGIIVDNVSLADDNDNAIVVDVEPQNDVEHDDNMNHLNPGEEGEEELMEFDMSGGPTLNPFYIPSIVSDLLKYLPIKEQEKLREVNSLWNEESCKILRKKRLVELHDVEAVGRYNARFAETNDFPHEIFQIWNDDITDNEPRMKRFFELFGLRIKSLDFHQLYLDGDVLMEMLSEKVPNLECLTILNVPRRVTPVEAPSKPQEPVAGPSSSPPSRRNQQRSFPKIKTVNLIRFPLDINRARSFLVDLFAACENLETLTIAKHIEQTATTGSAEAVSIETIGTLVMELIINNAAQMNHLSYLGFPFRLKEEFISALQNKEFPLTTLEMSLDTNIKSRSFTALMSVLGRTLANLSVTFNGNSTLLGNLPHCHLVNISSLSLTSFRGSLSFISGMTNLKTLSLHDVDLTRTLPIRGFQNFGRGDEQHKLSSFKSTGDSSDRDVVARITWCFPNLSKLHLHKLGDEGLGIIYRESPFLEELVLTDGTFTDSGLSGVPAEVCNDLWETMTIYDVNPERFRRDLFIGSLPHLRYLHLDSPAITDLAIMFGIIGTKLNTLSLKSSKITDISMPAIGEMRELTQLDIVHCPEVSEAGKYILKQKLAGRRLVFDPPVQSCLQRRARRIRASEIHEREIERLGIHRDRLVEVARAREMELRYAYRLFNQLQNFDMDPGGRHQHPRQHFIRHVLRRPAFRGQHDQEQNLNRGDIAQLLDIVHLDEMNMGNIDLNDNPIEPVAAGEIQRVPGVAAAGRLEVPEAGFPLGWGPQAEPINLMEEIMDAHGVAQDDDDDDDDIILINDDARDREREQQRIDIENEMHEQYEDREMLQEILEAFRHHDELAFGARGEQQQQDPRLQYLRNPRRGNPGPDENEQQD